LITHPILEGSQSIICGKMITKALPIASIIMKGPAPHKMSSIDISGGTIPFMMNRFNPTGGVI
jgi:hypothetical protein